MQRSHDDGSGPGASGRKRALPTPPPKISRDELYRFVLRCALLNTEAIGRAGGSAVAGTNLPSPGHPSSGSQGPGYGAPGSGAAQRPASWGADKVNAFLSELLLPSEPVGDPKRLLTREFLRKFRKRFTRVSEGKRVVLAVSDPYIARALTNFAITLMKQQAFKDRMNKNSTVAFLGAEFLRFCGDHAMLNPMPYARVLTDEAVDCLKYDCVGMPYVAAMIQQFEGYSREIAHKMHENAPSRPAAQTGSAQASGTVSEVYFHDSDGLVAWTRQVLGVEMDEHDKTARMSRAACTAKATIEDMKRCLAATEQDTHPVARPDDFNDSAIYLAWKKREIQQLNQLITHSVMADPRLLRTSGGGDYAPGQGREYGNTGAHGQPSNAPQFMYTFIPPNPRECYKMLVNACMETELQLSGRTPPDQRVLSARSTNLLKECGVRWRLGATFRDLAIIENLCNYLDKDMVCVEHVQEGFMTMRKNAARNEYNSWSNTDRRYLFQIHVHLNRTLLGMLTAALNSPENTSVDELSPILFMLDDIHDDENFRMAHPDLQGCRNELKAAIEDTASERFTRFKTRLLRQTLDAPEVDQMLLVAEALQTETSRMTNRFPVPIIGEVDVAGTSLGIYLKYFVLEMENLVNQPIDIDEDGMPSANAFQLYRAVIALQNLYKKRCPEGSLSMDVSSWFSRYVYGWLRVTETKTVEWVENVIREDKFEPISDTERHSSSVLDLFSIFQQQIDFLEGLCWPNEVQQALFVTILAKVFGRAVEKYCESMERLFVQDLVPKLQIERPSSPVNARRAWFDYTRSNDSKDQNSPTPVDLKPESCVRLNNIEAVRQRFNELYDTLDVDEVAYLISTNPQQNVRTDSSIGPPVYIYTVKVVLAENLADCDQNGLSDPYVVLQSGEVEMARTRVIQETLNPRWDETFEFRLSAAIEVLATIFDKDLVGGDDICGTAIFRLQPSLFGDFLAHDIWLDLQPQGRLLVRVSMEGEKNDIRFHFGKAFRTLKRTQTDMARMIMSGYVRYCLSRKVLFRSMKNSTALQQVTSLFRTSASSGKRMSITEVDGDEALHPLIDYLDKNLYTLFNLLRPDVSSMVFSKIWKEMLQNLENLLVPPLSDQPTTMKPLVNTEVEMVFTCLELLKTYFHGGDDGDGIPISTLESSKYHNLQAIRDMYQLSSEDLIARYQEQAAVANPVANRRNKSIMERRNLGTIRQLAKKKSETGADQLDCILRVLRLRQSKEARGFLVATIAQRTMAPGHQHDRPLPMPPAPTRITLASVSIDDDDDDDDDGCATEHHPNTVSKLSSRSLHMHMLPGASKQLGDERKGRVLSGVQRALPEPPVVVKPAEVYRAVLCCALLAVAPAASPRTRSETRLSLRGLSKRFSLGPADAQARALTLPMPRPSSMFSLTLTKSAAAAISSPVENPTPLTVALDHRGGIPGGDSTRPLTKEFLRRFRHRLSKIAGGKVAPLSVSDPAIVGRLATFAATTMKRQSFKDRMSQSSTVAFLAYEFLQYCGLPAARDPFPFVRVLRDEAIDCLRYECAPSADISVMVDQFVDYTQYVQKLVQSSELDPEKGDVDGLTSPTKRQGMMSATLPERGARARLRPSLTVSGDRESSASAAASGPLRDSEGLIEWTRAVFHVDRLEHAMVTKELMVTCTPKAGIDDYKRCVIALEHNGHPVVCPDDFENADAYAAWKTGEVQQLNQLIAYNVTADPGLLRDISLQAEGSKLSRSQYGTVSYAADEDPRTPRYISIPKYPRECYRAVVRACLALEIREHGVLPPSRTLMSPKSVQLLREIAVRWRIGQLTRDITLLECLCEHVTDGGVSIFHVVRAYSTIEKSYAGALCNAVLRSDRRLFYQVRVKLNRVLHQQLEDLLLSENTEDENIAATISLLERLHADPDFRRDHLRITPLARDTASIRITRAVSRRMRLAPDMSDIAQVMLLVEIVREEITALSGRFSAPLLDVDIVTTSIRVFMERLSEGLDSRPAPTREEYQQEGTTAEEYPGFRLYAAVREMAGILTSHGLTDTLNIRITNWFGRDVDMWLDNVEAQANAWAENAVAADDFQPVDSEQLYSPSVDQLFLMIQKSVDLLMSLKWPDEVEQAQFTTRLAKAISRAVIKYCTLVDTLFVKSCPKDEHKCAPTPESAPRRLLRTYALRKQQRSDDVHMVDLKVDTCICLNNIEEMRQRLDQLYYDLDVDEIGFVLEKSDVAALVPQLTEKKTMYLYTVKVVLAENLAGVEASPTSDGALSAILQSGEVEMARTRAVGDAANPRWDEAFDFPLSAAVEVQATVTQLGRPCGTASFRLQPSLFQDYFAHDIWLELQPQGRLLVRVSMEGEKDDIRFYFGKAFRTLKRTQADMIRVTVDQMSGRIRHCLSQSVLLCSTSSGGWHRIRSSLQRPGEMAERAALSAEELAEQALQPLNGYLDKNMKMLCEAINPKVATTVFTQIWKEVLQSVEKLMVPALSAQPTKMKPLKEPEVGVLMASLTILKQVFQKKNGRAGLTRSVLECPKYHELVLISELYQLPVKELIDRHRKLEENATHSGNGDSPNVGRSKSLIARRNLGTIRQLAKKKEDSGANQLECILRVLRLQATAEARRYVRSVLERDSPPNEQPTSATVVGPL
ncbi:hypothetical protein THASP1DRAFT_27249 [Thamnocephalis sphaerospora]|uniref:C2 domain-containing protein n=1 Tax=Thamnocephalis sphaerospora TaxID=78915 RepID=A0A4P9XXG1_9FUNG|nr:hypothetical protein THASP1DRAFT_27249 [Thamnocephalis sphaerospora]|eukprot:RKP11004.1 hypothetical protein THASP1DRAFT_27249 [Thamnocephalis sphaerospora]